MKRWIALSTLVTTAVLAQTVDSISDMVKNNLDQSPWEANLVGKIQLPDESMQDADFKLQVLPGKDPVVRVEFRKPASLEGNIIIVTKKEVWNYLYLNNQLIKQPRAKAKIDGMNFDFASFSDLDALTKGFNTKLLGEDTTPEGKAWKLLSTSKDKTLEYNSIESLVLKDNPRPYSFKFKNPKGQTTSEFTFKQFKRTKATIKNLKAYPSDAEVIKK